MPGFTCCVPGCYNNSHRDKALHFYTFPKDEELRRLWLKNVSRAGVKLPLMKRSLCNTSAFKSLAFVQRTGMRQKRSEFIYLQWLQTLAV
uniref:THAP domain-containing protein 11 n=1 Tax=Accipiter nisus TaxID=211598 RepID=A0A8B9RUL5_9AVES